jgi:DNA-binding transcriptional MerR regulator
MSKKNEFGVEKMMTRIEVIEIFRISLMTLAKWTKKGIVPSTKIGGRRLYLASDIKKLLNQLN